MTTRNRIIAPPETEFRELMIAFLFECSMPIARDLQTRARVWLEKHHADDPFVEVDELLTGHEIMDDMEYVIRQFHPNFGFRNGLGWGYHAESERVLSYDRR